MTSAKVTFEQNRLDNVEWSGVSRLSSLPSLPHDGQSPAQKTPLFYLMTVSVNTYQEDIYSIITPYL